MNPILKDIVGDVYKDFPIDDWPFDDQGMGGKDGYLNGMVREVCPKVLIEVGSWKGQSAITMAKTCLEINLKCSIICVDTWLGSEEHWRSNPGDLKIFRGRPTYYYNFLANVIHSNFTEVITPLCLPSISAADLLGHLKIKSDLTYIDASHDYDSVMIDLKKYWELRSEHGVVFGHDADYTPVKRAVGDFCKNTGLKNDSNGIFWRLRE